MSKIIHPWQPMASAASALALAVPLSATPAAPAPRTIAGPVANLAVDDASPLTGSTLPPVLFVHSYAGNSAHWKSALDQFLAAIR
jgi:pimeloyl-ACP methyl ester carboxylesterase